MSSKQRHQTAAKRDRERAVERKRTLKREKKQEAAAAAREGDAIPDPGAVEPLAADDSAG
jgi:hypothetical protein